MLSQKGQNTVNPVLQRPAAIQRPHTTRKGTNKKHLNRNSTSAWKQGLFCSQAVQGNTCHSLPYQGHFPFPEENMNSNITQNLLLEPVNQETSGQIVEGLLFFSQLQATLIPTESNTKVQVHGILYEYSLQQLAIPLL